MRTRSAAPPCPTSAKAGSELNRGERAARRVGGAHFGRNPSAGQPSSRPGKRDVFGNGAEGVWVRDGDGGDSAAARRRRGRGLLARLRRAVEPRRERRLRRSELRPAARRRLHAARAGGTGARARIAPNNDPFHLASDGAYVYFVSDIRVFRLPESSGAAEAITPPDALAVDGKLNGADIQLGPDVLVWATLSVPGFQRMPRDGGDIVTVATFPADEEPSNWAVVDDFIVSAWGQPAEHRRDDARSAAGLRSPECQNREVDESALCDRLGRRSRDRRPQAGGGRLWAGRRTGHRPRQERRRSRPPDRRRLVDLLRRAHRPRRRQLLRRHPPGAARRRLAFTGHRRSVPRARPGRRRHLRARPAPGTQGGQLDPRVPKAGGPAVIMAAVDIDSHGPEGEGAFISYSWEASGLVVDDAWVYFNQICRDGGTGAARLVRLPKDYTPGP